MDSGDAEYEKFGEVTYEKVPVSELRLYANWYPHAGISRYLRLHKNHGGVTVYLNEELLDPKTMQPFDGDVKAFHSLPETDYFLKQDWPRW